MKKTVKTLVLLTMLLSVTSLSAEGRTVRIFNAKGPICTWQSRDIVTYETRDGKDAESWAISMRKAGYSVNIDFDSDTGIYTCTAMKR